MIREFVFPDSVYKPDLKFLKFIKELGYNESQIRDFDFLFDERIVQYVKEHTNFRGISMRGKEDYRCKIGFCGTITPLSVDTNKQWTIKYTNEDTPYIKYIKIVTNKYGFTEIKSDN